MNTRTKHKKLFIFNVIQIDPIISFYRCWLQYCKFQWQFNNENEFISTVEHIVVFTCQQCTHLNNKLYNNNNASIQMQYCTFTLLYSHGQTQTAFCLYQNSRNRIACRYVAWDFIRASSYKKNCRIKITLLLALRLCWQHWWRSEQFQYESSSCCGV